MTAKAALPDDPKLLKTAIEFGEKLLDPWWRITSGELYKITIKGDEDGDNLVIPFKPNRAQKRLMKSLWHRNIILKARQLGFTTLICILWLDHALFNANVRCGIIAQDREAAEAIFRDKVKFAYDNLPDLLREAFPLKKDSSNELLFKHNNSSLRVATSLRSGTIHRLHVSEYGKICAKFPDKADEVMTGSIPTVPMSGILVIESTAEGQGGHFHKMTKRAIEQRDKGKKLNHKDFRMHFFAWWKEPGYSMDETDVVITKEDHDYFNKQELATGVKLDIRQRAWYVATRDSEFAGDEQKMWQEYPTTEEEAFQQSAEGCYYTKQLAAARKQGRIGPVPYVEGIPVNTFWDIGSSDGTGIWLHQRIGAQDRFIGYIEAWEEPYSYFIKELQDLGYVWGHHYVPHDADHERQQLHVVESPKDMLFKGGLRGIITVDRVTDIQHGIQITRAAFSTCWFDEANCKEGLAHLSSYKKTWNQNNACWNEIPSKIGGHSEAADAFRQFAQGYRGPSAGMSKKTTSSTNWKTA